LRRIGDEALPGLCRADGRVAAGGSAPAHRLRLELHGSQPLGAPEQQAADLKRALDAGIISQDEYNDEMEKLHDAH
jgi:hypothetical protein